MKGGFILAETMLAGAIISAALVALLPSFILTIKANKVAEQTKVATQLSTELLEEIRLRRWDQLTPLPPSFIAFGSTTLGPDAGETATDKRTFNDVDDFNGWTEAPPSDPMNQVLPDFVGYSRTVTILYVDSTLAAAASKSDYKKVTVCTKSPKGISVCLDTILTNR